MAIASIIMMVFMMFIDHGDMVYDDGIGVHYNIIINNDNEHNIMIMNIMVLVTDYDSRQWW